MEKKWKSTADVIKDNRIQCILYAGFLQAFTMQVIFMTTIIMLCTGDPSPHFHSTLHCGTWVTNHNTTTKAFSNLRQQQQSGQMKGRARELESHRMTWEMEVQTGLWPNSCRDWWLCHATKCLLSANKGSGGPGEKCFLWQRRIREVSSHVKLTVSLHVHTLTHKHAGYASSCCCPHPLSFILCCSLSSISTLLHISLAYPRSWGGSHCK